MKKTKQWISKVKEIDNQLFWETSSGEIFRQFFFNYPQENTFKFKLFENSQAFIIILFTPMIIKYSNHISR